MPLLLSGCFGPFGGQSAADAEDQLLEIPGIGRANVACERTWSGPFVTSDYTIVSIELDEGVTVASASELMDYLIALGWSARDRQPNQPMNIAVRSDPQVSVPDLAEQAGWPAESLSDVDTTVFVQLADIEERLGGWPGTPPEVPEGMLNLP